ncbi:hypothetical protein [Psittacicella hinzii]|uniref:Uncharacterized protein n=1 Tax=Psittacicella hinzii TaxID=2028575 RepID=A0A3A1YQ78_9GAMM|nr:hypothetical protein [Psittacicella hinzii]RIY39681.1 hypothetical protein CKF58_01670 [Psittacicella hinzii]
MVTFSLGHEPVLAYVSSKLLRLRSYVLALCVFLIASCGLLFSPTSQANSTATNNDSLNEALAFESPLSLVIEEYNSLESFLQLLVANNHLPLVQANSNHLLSLSPMEFMDAVTQTLGKSLAYQYTNQYGINFPQVPDWLNFGRDCFKLFNSSDFELHQAAEKLPEPIFQACQVSIFYLTLSLFNGDFVQSLATQGLYGQQLLEDTTGSNLTLNQHKNYLGKILTEQVQAGGFNYMPLKPKDLLVNNPFIDYILNFLQQKQLTINLHSQQMEQQYILPGFRK